MRRNAIFLEKLERKRVYLTRWAAACAVCPEAILPAAGEIRFGQDAASGVARTEKKHVVAALTHRAALAALLAAFPAALDHLWSWCAARSFLRFSLRFRDRSVDLCLAQCMVRFPRHSLRISDPVLVRPRVAAC